MMAGLRDDDDLLHLTASNTFTRHLMTLITGP